MRVTSFRPFLAAAALAAALVAGPAAAQHWRPYGHFGFFIAPPVYIPPPIYVPPAYVPPVYLAPPAVYAPSYYPAPGYAAPPGQACYAGAYVCPLDRQLAPGAACSCPANTGRVWGQAR